ncbi:MAG: hypothetical protein J5563_04835, partial [Clostridia bacterium]|nr:hypothetical protein [Clostridia bacterium]
TGMEKYRSVDVISTVKQEKKYEPAIEEERVVDWNAPDDDETDVTEDTDEILSDEEIDSGIDSIIEALNT